MSANQSNLSSAMYGFDVVVATTQESINSFLDNYFYEKSQETPEQKAQDSEVEMVTMYYGMNAQGNIYQMDKATLMSQTGNVDPFSIPAWDGTGTMPAGVTALNQSDFAYGFKAELGLPPSMSPNNPDAQSVPNIITIDPGGQTVSYNMLCSTFIVVQCTFGRRGIVNYLNVSQPDNGAWIFTSIVPLAKINDNTNLPAAVQNQVNTMSGEFSVQKLLLDIDTAMPQTSPTMSGVDNGSDVYAALQKDFLDEYFSALKAKGEPVLGYSITVPPSNYSTLNITQVDLLVEEFIPSNGADVLDPKDLSTLNYLCSTNGSAMPSPRQFSWNWIDNDTEAQNYHGIIAVNRNILANYFENQLTPIISRNCYATSVSVTLDSASAPVYQWGLAGGQTPTIISPKDSTGSTVISYSYSSTSSDEAGLDGDIGQMTLTCNMDASVVFSGNTIVITQHLVIYVYLNHLSTGASGNVVDKTITDTYTLTAGDDGKMLMKLDTSTKDVSQTPSVNGFLNFWTGVTDMFGDVENVLNAFIPTVFTDIPVSGLQNFVFPGGNTFSFKDVNFSDNQDLVTHITYVDAG